MDKVQHPLQSFEWGEFRKLTGVKVVREGGIQVTIHKIPWTPWNIGYAPKTEMIDERMRETLEKIARENNCICIKLEPRVEKSKILNHKFSNSQIWSAESTKSQGHRRDQTRRGTAL